MIINQFLARQERKFLRTRHGIQDRPIRSLIKTITWRCLGTLDTILISYLITNTWLLALSIGGIEVISKVILYYVHERLWNHIAWARR